MKCVLDSSVAFKWELAETGSDKAGALREDFRNAVHELLGPDIFNVELAHALTRAERQGRIARGEARQHFIDMATTPPRFFPVEPRLLRAIDISSNTRVGVCDCLYVALGERQGCEVVTADTKLINTLQKDFPFIVALASL